MDDEATDSQRNARRLVSPLADPAGVRRDLTKYVRTRDKGDMLVAAERLRSFDRPALVIWAKEDHIMPPAHGRRLAELLPHGRLLEIADSYTLIPEDQPGELARAIRQFVRDRSCVLDKSLSPQLYLFA